MILKNPTQSDVYVQINGSEYTVLAGESITVSEEVGKAWMRVHGFLQPVDEPVKDILADEPKKEEVKVEEEISEVPSKNRVTKSKNK